MPNDLPSQVLTSLGGAGVAGVFLYFIAKGVFTTRAHIDDLKGTIQILRDRNDSLEGDIRRVIKHHEESVIPALVEVTSVTKDLLVIVQRDRRRSRGD